MFFPYQAIPAVISPLACRHFPLRRKVERQVVPNYSNHLNARIVSSKTFFAPTLDLVASTGTVALDLASTGIQL